MEVYTVVNLKKNFFFKYCLLVPADLWNGWIDFDGILTSIEVIRSNLFTSAKKMYDIKKISQGNNAVTISDSLSSNPVLYYL